MARPLRLEFPGAFYHVIHRGNAGETIFRSSRDRNKFLEYLGRTVERFGMKVHTYCLMTNHYHLLIETPEANLSQAIKWLNVSYAAYFNRKRQRKGHLFQGRFKSILVDADAYLKQLSRYIHLNPLRANMVERLAAYPWSSYPAFTGKIKAPAWLELDWLLAQFGRNRKEAQSAYERFVEDIELKTLQDPAEDIVGGFILGDEGFVTWIKDTYLCDFPAAGDFPQLNDIELRPTPEDIVGAVSKEFGRDIEEILKKGKKKNTARDVAIYLSKELTGTMGTQLGKYFGNISGAGITVRCNHATKEMAADRKLMDKIRRLKKTIINN